VIYTIINKDKWVSFCGVFCTGTNLYQLCIDHQTSIFVEPSPPRLLWVLGRRFDLVQSIDMYPLTEELVFKKIGDGIKHFVKIS